MKTLEIILSASAAFALGYVWYGLLFKKHWSEFTRSRQSGAAITDATLIFLSLCLVSYFMNNGCLEMHINEGNFSHGLFHGGLYGLSYAVPILLIHAVYQKRRVVQWVIDASYAILAYAAIGGLLALLPLTQY